METSGELDRALTELGTFVREEIAATSGAIGCLRAIATQILSDIQASGDHESVRLIDAEVEGFTFVPRITGLNGAQTFLREVSVGGNIHARLTQQLIVTIFTGWDAFHQARIAKARGLEAGELKSVYFGDLRLLRNDIAHSRGLTKRSVRCVGAVLFRERKTDDLIYLGDDENRAAQLASPVQRADGSGLRAPALSTREVFGSRDIKQCRSGHKPTSATGGFESPPCR